MIVNPAELSASQYGFFVDYLHIAFLLAVLIGYLYFRRTHVSPGGSLAVGYLSAGLFFPLNVLATIGIALISFVVIHFVVLKIWLPRPRRIFAIGLFTGVFMGFLWLVVVDGLVENTFEIVTGLALVGVIVPGMLCNSFNKQGVLKTLVPLAWMIPLATGGALLITWIISQVVGTSAAENLFEPTESNTVGLFALSAVSVISAILVQEGPLARFNLRTGGYVTAGLIVATAGDLRYFGLILLVSLAVWGVGELFTRSTPLFGKDRFILLVMLSFSFAILLELIILNFWDAPFNGAENLVYCVLPAVIANDLLQYRPRRVVPGMLISVMVCAILSGLFFGFTGELVSI